MLSYGLTYLLSTMCHKKDQVGLQRVMPGQDALNFTTQGNTVPGASVSNQCSQEEYKWKFLGEHQFKEMLPAQQKKVGWLCFTLPRSQVHRKDTFINCSGQYQACSSTTVDNCRPRQHFKKRPQILSSTKVIICRLCMTSYEAELTNVHQAGSGELTSMADTVITQPAKWNEG